MKAAVVVAALCLTGCATTSTLRTVRASTLVADEAMTEARATCRSAHEIGTLTTADYRAFLNPLAQAAQAESDVDVAVEVLFDRSLAPRVRARAHADVLDALARLESFLHASLHAIPAGDLRARVQAQLEPGFDSVPAARAAIREGRRRDQERRWIGRLWERRPRLRSKEVS